MSEKFNVCAREHQDSGKGFFDQTVESVCAFANKFTDYRVGTLVAMDAMLKVCANITWVLQDSSPLDVKKEVLTKFENMIDKTKELREERNGTKRLDS